MYFLRKYESQQYLRAPRPPLLEAHVLVGGAGAPACANMCEKPVPGLVLSKIQGARVPRIATGLHIARVRGTRGSEEAARGP